MAFSGRKILNHIHFKINKTYETTLIKTLVVLVKQKTNRSAEQNGESRNRCTRTVSVYFLQGVKVI